MRPEDIVIEKRRFSSFYNTNLDDVLRNLGCEQVYIIGYSGDVCVRFTSVDAYNRGYRIGLIYEGIESFRESRDSSLEYLEWVVDAERLTMDEFRKAVLPS
jgi:nicotinamidase/pyrazinamidase